MFQFNSYSILVRRLLIYIKKTEDEINCVEKIIL